VVLAVTAVSLPAVAQFQRQRKLSGTEQKIAMAALLDQPSMAMSEDPSCKANLQQSGQITVARALGDALARAANEAKPLTVKIDCFVRRGYPLAADQEYCRLGFVVSRRAKATGYGLAFLMDWNQRAIVPESVECY
jgi:hypothetical protein